MGKLIDVQHAVCHSSSLTLNFRWIQLVETLARQWPIKIVTIGWSSTEGDGTSDLAASSYPSRLQDTLRNRWPTASVTVVNKGVDEVARFKSDVTAQDPVLVIRRVGTSSVWSDHCVEEVTSSIIRGFGRPSRRKMDIIVMDLQYAPALVTHEVNGLRANGLVDRCLRKGNRGQRLSPLCFDAALEPCRPHTA